MQQPSRFIRLVLWIIALQFLLQPVFLAFPVGTAFAVEPEESVAESQELDETQELNVEGTDPLVATVPLPASTMDQSQAESLLSPAEQSSWPPVGTDYVVDRTIDAVDYDIGDGICATSAGECTLRAAIQEANVAGGTIAVRAGTYTLTIEGAGEDNAATGDLDILNNVTIIGEDTQTTRVDAKGIDRVFYILQPYWNGNDRSVTIQNITITGGNVTDSGGGIYSRGEWNNGGLQITLENVVIDGNSSTGMGGGLYVVEAHWGSTILTITDSTISNNTSGSTGGGIAIHGDRAYTYLTNVTLSDNVAANYGGGLSTNYPSEPTYFTHVTVVNNRSGSGGAGVWTSDLAGTIYLRNTILVDNTVNGVVDNCETQGRSSIATSGTNLANDTTCGTGSSTLIVSPNEASYIGPLQDNGGSTFTHSPLPGSQAIDSASSTYCPATDQRGYPRDSAACDIGAVEDIGTVMVDRLSSGSQIDCPCENYGFGAYKVTPYSINTRTGSEAFSLTDITIQTDTGPVSFTRSYSTFNARDVAGGYLVPGVMSPGWFHNYEMRLLLSGPGSESGKILLQTPGGSRLAFDSTTYEPEPGVGGALTYDAQQQRYTYRNSQDVSLTFDANGRLIEMDNGRGQVLSFLYPNNRLKYIATSVENGVPLGRYLMLVYDDDGHLRKVGDQTLEDPDPSNDRYVEYTYPTSGDFNLTRVRDIRGSYWNLSYVDANTPGFEGGIPSGMEYLRHYVYKRYQATRDLNANLQTVPVQLEYRYNPDTIYTGDSGRTYVRAVEERDGAGRILAAINFAGTNGIEVTYGQGTAATTEIHQYDVRNTLSDSGNTAGSQATSYDDNFRPEVITDANDHNTTLDWSSDGASLTWVTDTTGTMTSFVYDAEHHLVILSNPDGSRTQFVYNQQNLFSQADGAYTGAPNPYYNSAWDSGMLVARIDTPDLALNGAASQSSTYANGISGRAVDGNTNGIWANNSVSITESTANAWWEVDLGVVSYIDTIALWNRTDDFSERLADFYVFVSDVPFDSTSLTTTLAQPGVSNYYTSDPVEITKAFAIGRTGRHIRIQLAGTNYLQLAEVTVYGDASSGQVTVYEYTTGLEAAVGSAGTMPKNLPYKVTNPDGVATCYAYNTYGQQT